MATVTIGANDYETYATVAEATTYLDASLSSSAAAFRAATADDKARSLVMATRWIDSQQWQGEKTSGVQVLEWPRTGIEGLDDSVVPPQVVQASIELAAMIVENPALMTEISAGGAVETKHLVAGSAEIEYFRSANAFKWKNTIFPANIWNLLKQWLSGYGTAVAGAESFDTCQPSAFERGYGLTDGFS